jgi:trigger factor
MKIQVEAVSPVEKKVTIEIDPDRVATEIAKGYASLGRRVKLKGFRPGKAPRHVLERSFKDQVEGEVLERLVGETFSEAVKQESIAAVAPPQVHVEEPGLGEGRSLRYTARVEVKPRLEPKDYKGLSVAKRVPEVTEQMISDELTRIQDSMAQLVPIEDRLEAREGDHAVIDHEGTIGGQPFEGGKGEGVTVQVRPGDLVDGNIPALAGKKLGETVELDQTFPATYRVEALRNKVARFKLTLKALKTRQVPSLDDELVKDLGIEGIATLDALRKRIREDLEKRERHRVESEHRDALVKAALRKNDFEVPPALVERAIDAMLEGTAERFARQGIDIRQLDLDVARLRGDLREQALLQVKGALLLEAIGDAEKIEATDADVQAELARMAGDLGVPLAKVQQQFRGGEARTGLKNRIREDKALALLSANAVAE